MENKLNKKEVKEIEKATSKALGNALKNPNNIKKLNKIKIQNKYPVIACIIIVLTIFFMFIYYYVSNNPKTIFKNSFKNMTSSFLENYNKDIIQGQIKITKARKEYLINYKSDNKSNIIHIGNTAIYQINNKTYLYNKDISDNYILMPKSIYYNYNKLSKTINDVQNIIIKNINNQKYYTKKETIIIDSKYQDILKDSLIIKEPLINKLKTDLNNSQIKEELKELTGNTYNINLDRFNGTLLTLYLSKDNHEFIKLINTKDNQLVFIFTKTSDNKYQFKIDNIDINTSVLKTNNLKTPLIDSYIKEKQLDNNTKNKLNTLIKTNEALKYILNK